MVIKAVSIFDCKPDRLFIELKKSKSLVYVAKPMLVFAHYNKNEFPKIWVEEKYPVSLHMFGFIPLGKHWVDITIDEKLKQLKDDGRGKLVRQWNHNIYANEADNGKTLYVDIVNIKANVLTPFVALFAYKFYRHRQRRWEKIISQNFQY